MQTINVRQEPTALILGLPAFGRRLYATDKGLDHPTPPAADPTKTGSKTPPKPEPAKAPEPGKKV
jgi:hypothetical protein